MDILHLASYFLHLTSSLVVKGNRASYCNQTLLKGKIFTSSIARCLDQAVKRPISFVHCAAIEGKLDTRVLQVIFGRKLIGPRSVDPL